VDTNDGGSYANADIRESFTDRVTLDSNGGATHAMTITYTYAAVAHGYAQTTQYRNLARVVLPGSATRLAASGPCTPVNVRQSAHQVVACQFMLTRGASATISFSWYVPSVVTVNQAQEYRLLVQRQAGTARTANVTVSPPPGTALSNHGGPGAVAGGSLAWMQNPQTIDATIVATLRS
jgi:hypothetical protein